MKGEEKVKYRGDIKMRSGKRWLHVSDVFDENGKEYFSDPKECLEAGIRRVRRDRGWDDNGRDMLVEVRENKTDPLTRDMCGDDAPLVLSQRV